MPILIRQGCTKITYYTAPKGGQQWLDKNCTNFLLKSLAKEWMEQGLLNIPHDIMRATQGVVIDHILWLHNIVTVYEMIKIPCDWYHSIETTK